MKKWITALFIMVAFLYYSNNVIEVSEYIIESRKWPSGLDGYTIVHLSDLHNKSFGTNQTKLMKKIKSLNPDLIVMTGDVIDRRRYNKVPAINLMQACVDIGPTAYVTGNHEVWHGTAAEMRQTLKALGVIVLNNETVQVSTGHGSFSLSGLADRADFMGQYDYESMLVALSKTTKPEANEDSYHILLSHRPEQFDAYAASEFDLSLSGHSHGGQFRLPFIGGLIAPDQGLFPRYDGGLYKKDSYKMIVSRGLGNSLMPIRLFNQPEIPVIRLYKSSE